MMNHRVRWMTAGAVVAWLSGSALASGAVAAVAALPSHDAGIARPDGIGGLPDLLMVRGIDPAIPDAAQHPAPRLDLAGRVRIKGIIPAGPPPAICKEYRRCTLSARRRR